ncbi:transporter, major facilitator family protein [Leptospira wolbachii serovar Codice str. CDC]|uniref:Transporter, major facilitator family protein n=1 Tax=Leptospira wolbachii serovar Codice str. CDC TaxID=1218599 RepID=R9A595_9LEPT|nr:MFS transporter [Leptospira wolbachii]EOQ95420.1 transporter, major facilitator family protein [Leptospira wolbachii serovar Codice str. CDC]
MNQIPTKIYPYRWVVLFAYIVITATICLQWLTYAPIARDAKEFYKVSPIQIDLLSLVFLGVFVIIAIPASYVIDTYGIKKGVGFGAILTGVCGLMKGIYAADYTIVLFCQMGLAVAQPFLLNAVTKISVLWFPIQERATAVALGTLAQFLGIILVMILTPILLQRGNTIPDVMMIYGFVSVVSAILFLLLIKEKPPTSPSTHGEDHELPFLEGLRFLWKQKDMRKILFLFLIGLGVFNAVSTCIDQICEIKGLNIDESGLVGGVMLISGIIGGIIIPPISDKLQKRKIFLIIAMAGFLVGLSLFVLFQGFIFLLIGSIVIGFFLLGIGAPIGFQYCAEITSPAPESTSQGLLLLVGQVSGILFILGLNFFGMVSFLYILLFLSIVNFIMVFWLKESPFMES